MTMSELKAQLPDIKVESFGGKVQEWRLVGRKRAFGLIYEPYGHGRFEVSWETLLNCVNNDTPIQII